MSEVYEWDAVAANNNDTPPDGFPENMADSNVNNSARELMAAIKRWHTDLSGGGGTSGGTVNNYTYTTSTGEAAYYDGMTFTIKPTVTNTGPSTVNVNSIGAADILLPDGTALVGGELVAGAYYILVYDSTDSGFKIVTTAGTSTTGGSTLEIENVTYTSSTTLSSTDQCKMVIVNSATAAVLTIGTEASQSYTEGRTIGVHRRGTGAVSIATATGSISILYPETLNLRKQYSTAALYYEGSDVWILMGNTEAAT